MQLYYTYVIHIYSEVWLLFETACYHRHQTILCHNMLWIKKGRTNIPCRVYQRTEGKLTLHLVLLKFWQKNNSTVSRTSFKRRYKLSYSDLCHSRFLCLNTLFSSFEYCVLAYIKNRLQLFWGKCGHWLLTQLSVSSTWAHPWDLHSHKVYPKQTAKPRNKEYMPILKSRRNLNLLCCGPISPLVK